ncbi:MAG: DUF3047 domain-containing protein [Simplicispira suum]|uniref:DUF3047 domain-containing protein n=1 Tax=Simplicispira suum TaxID=2109915 RepID=UPI001C6CA7F0|nr:DUF3047 domain-containing protein [Simplicispira suum]MBW7833003.1 DUF3047 domain-containing protein [Simplicispira suum]
MTRDPCNRRCRRGVLVLLLGVATSAVSASVRVGDFAAGSDALPAPWKVVQLDERVPATRYRPLQWDGRAAIEARADASMALLARPLTVDLQTTPVLCWLWRVDDVLKQADLSRKAGDDYAARVYVTFTLPPESMSAGLRFKLALGRSLYGELVPDAAVNYVWDNRHPIGTRAFNAYTDRAAMVVQRSGKAQAGRWVSERVNVLADATQAFGKLPFRASLLAVASDTDNTGEQARAGFAELHFVAAEEPCQFSGPPVQ